MKEWLLASIIGTIILVTVIGLTYISCIIGSKFEIEQFEKKVQIIEKHNLTSVDLKNLEIITNKGEEAE